VPNPVAATDLAQHAAERRSILEGSRPYSLFVGRLEPMAGDHAVDDVVAQYERIYERVVRSSSEAIKSS
jgi:hypothetical protein